VRDLALFNLAIDSKLRGCDLVALRVDDVAPNGYAIDRANVRQSKIGRPVRFELTEVTRQALDDYLRASGRKLGQCLFPGRGGLDRHLTTRQYARLVAEWVSGIGLDPLKYATHSMRRTKATLIYRRTGNPGAVQLLLDHTRIESTVRYLGVEIDDALAIAEPVAVLGEGRMVAHTTRVALRDAQNRSGTRYCRYRVIYFATHALGAGEVGGLGEPALALSTPARWPRSWTSGC
jgi:integrase